MKTKKKKVKSRKVTLKVNENNAGKPMFVKNSQKEQEEFSMEEYLKDCLAIIQEFKCSAT